MTAKKESCTQDKIKFQNIICGAINQKRDRAYPAPGFQTKSGNKRWKDCTYGPHTFIGACEMKTKRSFIMQKKRQTDSQ